MQIDTVESVSVIEQLQNGFTLHARTHAEHLAKIYIIKNPNEVGEFIGENLYLLDILEEVPGEIYRYFGSDQKLVLKVSAEPDILESSELWIEILTKLSAKEAMPVLEEFDKNWWLENMERANCKLNITLKFV